MKGQACRLVQSFWRSPGLRVMQRFCVEAVGNRQHANPRFLGSHHPRRAARLRAADRGRLRGGAPAAAPKPPPAPQLPPPAPPPPPALPSVPAPSSQQPLALVRVTELALQPAQAGTSGQHVDGSVADVAFLPPDGRNVVAVGNDDRAWIAELSTGRAHWKSRPLGKDAERVVVCDNRFAVQTYGGRLALFEWVPEGRGRVIDCGRFELGDGQLLGLFAGCSQAAYATLDGKLLAFDLMLGSVAKVMRDANYVQFESRVTDTGWIVVPGAPRPQVRNLRAGDTFEPELAASSTDGRLMQAFVVAGDQLLTEHCTQTRACVVRLHDLEGRPRLEHRFDGSRGVWTGDVPSRIATSAELRYFSWYRDGLPLQVVETETGRRTELPAISRTMSAVVAAAFSPFETGKLAVTLTPAPNRVTVYEIR